MKPLYRNLFFAFGLVAIGLLIWRFPDGWQIIRLHLDRVICYLPLVVGSWIPVYALTAYAFRLLVNTGHADRHISLDNSPCRASPFPTPLPSVLAELPIACSNFRTS